MTWHVFVLVWGEAFVRRFAELSVPFQVMAGNVPALADESSIVYHAYTDAASAGAVAKALAPLERWCDLDVRLFDDTSARGLSDPDYKYELQRSCLRDLATRAADGDPIVLLDSNFALANGTLAALVDRRRQGYRAATASLLRVETETFAARILPLLKHPAAIGARDLLRQAMATMHPMTRAFFVDADAFTPYPSRLSWRVGDDGFLNRDFLPHPLMVPASNALTVSQSTMDYDLALRSAGDEEIHVCNDSDEMLVVKFSDAGHHANRVSGAPATTRDIGQFLLASTNRRHRLFADVPIAFHTGDHDTRYAAARASSQILIDGAYAWIDQIAAQPSQLDARGLMYLKSHLGPIEDFMSPQLEPAALARLS